MVPSCRRRSFGGKESSLELEEVSSSERVTEMTSMSFNKKRFISACKSTPPALISISDTRLIEHAVHLRNDALKKTGEGLRYSKVDYGQVHEVSASVAMLTDAHPTLT